MQAVRCLPQELALLVGAALTGPSCTQVKQAPLAHARRGSRFVACTGWKKKGGQDISNWKADLIAWKDRERRPDVSAPRRFGRGAIADKGSAAINRPPMLSEAERQQLREAEARKHDPDYIALVQSIGKRAEYPKN